MKKTAVCLLLFVFFTNIFVMNFSAAAHTPPANSETVTDKNIFDNLNQTYFWYRSAGWFAEDIVGENVDYNFDGTVNSNNIDLLIYFACGFYVDDFWNDVSSLYPSGTLWADVPIATVSKYVKRMFPSITFDYSLSTKYKDGIYNMRQTDSGGETYHLIYCVKYDNKYEFQYMDDDADQIDKQDKDIIFTTDLQFRLLSAVKTVSKIEIESPPVKITYSTGEAIDLTGGIVKYYFTDNTFKSYNMTNEMISGYNSSTPGNKTITVTVQGKIATFSVEIISVTTPNPSNPTENTTPSNPSNTSSITSENVSSNDTPSYPIANSSNDLTSSVIENDVYLSNLEFDNGKLSPKFSPQITEYVLKVDFEVENIKTTATPENADATVEITGGENLIVGSDNFIKIVCSENNEISKIYNINVIRADKNGVFAPSKMDNNNTFPLWAVIIISIIILCLAGVGGYFGYKYFNNRNKNS